MVPKFHPWEQVLLWEDFLGNPPSVGCTPGAPRGSLHPPTPKSLRISPSPYGSAPVPSCRGQICQFTALRDVALWHPRPSHGGGTGQGPGCCPQQGSTRARVHPSAAIPSPRHRDPRTARSRRPSALSSPLAARHRLRGKGPVPAGTGLARRGRGWHHRPLPPPLPAGMPGAGGAQRCSGGVTSLL